MILSSLLELLLFTLKEENLSVHDDLNVWHFGSINTFLLFFVFCFCYFVIFFFFYICPVPIATKFVSSDPLYMNKESSTVNPVYKWNLTMCTLWEVACKSFKSYPCVLLWWTTCNVNTLLTELRLYYESFSQSVKIPL